MSTSLCPFLALTGGDFRHFLSHAPPVFLLAGFLLGIGSIIAYRKDGLNVAIWSATLVAAAPVIMYALYKLFGLATFCTDCRAYIFLPIVGLILFHQFDFACLINHFRLGV